MEGFVKLEVHQIDEHNHSIDAEADLTEVGILEKAALVSAFLKAININTEPELKLVLMAREIVEESRKKGDS